MKTSLQQHSNPHSGSLPGLRRVLLVFPFVAILVLPSPAILFAGQAPSDKTSSPELIRPCSLLPANSKAARTGKRKSSANPNPASACLEAKGSPLEFQEFFQSYARAQSWPISEEKIVEDGWIFSRSLSKDELLQFAKEGPYAGRVNWTEGKALVQVTTREPDGGYTRVEISARLQGNGQSVDRFSPPKDTWDLESSGALEKILIAALETHLKSLR